MVYGYIDIWIFAHRWYLPPLSSPYVYPSSFSTPFLPLPPHCVLDFFFPDPRHLSTFILGVWSFIIIRYCSKFSMFFPCTIKALFACYFDKLKDGNKTFSIPKFAEGYSDFCLFQKISNVNPHFAVWKFNWQTLTWWDEGTQSVIGAYPHEFMWIRSFCERKRANVDPHSFTSTRSTVDSQVIPHGYTVWTPRSRPWFNFKLLESLRMLLIY